MKSKTTEGAAKRLVRQPYSDAKLAKMSLAELNKLEARIQVAMNARREIDLADVRAKIEAQAAAVGLSVKEIFGNFRKPLAKVAVKYVNNEDVTQTWTGRGRMPLWLKAKTGGDKTKLTKYLVA